jgi:hypothetical protein
MLLAAALGLGCDRNRGTNSDWFVRPTGSLGGGTIVVDRSDRRIELERDAAGTPIALVVAPAATADTTRLWLATRSDAAVLLEPRGILAETPVLPAGRLIFPADSTVAEAPDSATLLRIETPRQSAGRETLWIAAHGNLALHLTATALTVYRGGTAIERYPETTRVDTIGRGYLLLPPFGGPLPIEPPPPPPAESQMQFVPERDAVRFFDATGEVSAELPSQALQVQGGEQGLLLVGSFPNGLAGVEPQPFDVLLPLHAHRLIVLRGAR